MFGQSWSKHGLLSVVIFLTTIFLPSFSFAENKVMPNLFVTSQEAYDTSRITANNPTIKRTRLVNIDLNILNASKDNKNSAATPFILNLFDNKSLVAINKQVKVTNRGFIWEGFIQNEPLSTVTLVVNNNIVAGNIVYPNGRYQIRFVGNNVHSIQEIDERRMPADEPYVPSPQSSEPQVDLKKNTNQALDSADRIDVMVAYSATTRAAAGGTAAMQALIDLAISETNAAYVRSGVTFRLNLVHSVEVAYTEQSSLDHALNCITSTSDGCLDNIHSLRDTYKADLVSFWVENGGNYCGLAWLMQNVSSGFANNGFSTVATNCATGYYSFGHELGHNMGLRHDTFVDTSTTPYAHAHGYAYPAGQWRSIMAYNNACTAAGVNCTRLQFFSNPNKTQNGVATGHATTADNARVLNATASTVANFRQAGSSPTNYTLTVTKAGSGSGTVTSSPSGISCGTDCTEQYALNTGVTLTATATAGSSFTGWTGACSGSASTCTVSMNAAKTVTATFAPSTSSCSVGALSIGTTVSGTWAAGCNSVHRVGRFAKYYSFTLSSSKKVTIDLMSTTDTYLYLLSGRGTTGAILAFDDDAGDGSNSRISATLSAGTYTLESTTYNSGMTGSFTISVRDAPMLTVTKAGSGSGTVTSSPSGISCGTDCTEQYALNTGVTLTATATAGSSFTGWTGACSGSASTCTVSMNAAKTVTATFVPSTCSISTLNIGATTSGTWAAGCNSVHRAGRFAKYHSFTLSSRRTVTIDLTSTTVDTYLYLLAGRGTTGAVLAYDDDSGSGHNSKIVITLNAGTYTLESTTYTSNVTGSFTLSIR